MIDRDIYEPFKKRPYLFQLRAFRKGTTDNYRTHRLFSCIEMYKMAMLYDTEYWDLEMSRLPALGSK